jgi:hypothetical protein
LVLTKNSTSKRSGVEITIPNVSGVLENFGFGSLLISSQNFKLNILILKGTQVLGLQIPMLQLILVCRQRYSNYDSADEWFRVYRG